MNTRIDGTIYNNFQTSIRAYDGGEIMQVSKERIVDITKHYANSALPMQEVANYHKISTPTLQKYIKYCQDFEPKLYEKAYAKIQKNKKDKRDKKLYGFALQAFDNLKAKEIKKSDLIDWWIKNVKSNNLPVSEVVRLAEKRGIKVIR